ncbi:MAG: caspase family protein [Caldilineaceae bacterium]|nr:caspase family protein [Caldilineaceae bacterium]MBP8122835.1 caspase family protein [Caldilineaceae bacterium]MBP9073757.1 caspase family protein [Caldilineaceae bacterium]
MAKKALCVGINDYPYDGSDLNGCINDAKSWAELLVGHYDFPLSDVKLLLDAEATKANIMAGLTALLAGANSGDILVFTNASHGTYIADTSGDEPSYDEALCPYDCATNLIVDDELRDLFHGLAKGVRLVVISDSCFSGTVTRAVLGENVPGLKLPDDRRVRFLNPALMGRAVLENPWKAKPKGKEKYPESKMGEVLLSGSTDKEYSNDALIDGAYHGAMSYYAQQIIREMNYQVTYQQLQSQLLFLLDDAGYPQHPQIEGKTANKKRPIFT